MGLIDGAGVVVKGAPWGGHDRQIVQISRGWEGGSQKVPQGGTVPAQPA